MTADEQSTMCYFLGKRSDHPENIKIFNHKQARTKSEIIKVDQRRKRYKSICEKRAITSDTSSNSNKNEECGGEKEEVNLDFTIHESCSAGKNMQCDLYKNEIEKLQKELIAYKAELIERNEEIYKLCEENNLLKTSKSSYEYLKKSDDKVTFFIGLNCSRFIWLFNKVKSSIKILLKKLSLEDHMLVVLVKLKLGLLNKDLAVCFDISISRISKIFRSLVPLIAAHMTNLIVWPDHGIIRRHFPQSFKKNFKDCVCMIDCSEIFIERPKNLTARAQTRSNYKHNNTSKYLIGITPAGAISFSSLGWGGRVSDKQIMKGSGFFNKVSMGDCILADRGFNIKDELSALGATICSYLVVRWIRQDSSQVYKSMWNVLYVELKNSDFYKLHYH